MTASRTAKREALWLRRDRLPGITCGRRPAVLGLAAALLAGSRRGAHADSVAGVCAFGVFPYLPALTVEKLYGPVAVELAEVLGTDIQLKTKETFEDFGEEVAVGAYDLLVCHPFLYVEASARQGYVPLARVDQELRAVLLSRDAQELRSLEALRGQTIALPPRLASVSYLMALALIEAGLRPDGDVPLRHYQTKVSCLHAVAAGDAVACVVPSFMLDQLDAIKKMGLHPVWRSAPVSSLLFAAHPRVPAAKRDGVTGRLVGWRGSEHGRAILAAFGWPGLLPASDADYADVRALSGRLRTYASR
jgi:ABC-type phosphate/phosphonate transport system substrate-binding protein